MESRYVPKLLFIIVANGAVGYLFPFVNDGSMGGHGVAMHEI